MDLAKFLKTPFVTKHLRWLLLDLLENTDATVDHDTDPDEMFNKNFLLLSLLPLLFNYMKQVKNASRIEMLLFDMMYL